MKVFETPRTKAEIMDWYTRAKQILERRRYGEVGIGRLAMTDYEAYLRSVESLFLRLKTDFNLRLRAKKNGEA